MNCEFCHFLRRSITQSFVAQLVVFWIAISATSSANAQSSPKAMPANANLDFAYSLERAEGPIIDVEFAVGASVIYATTNDNLIVWDLDSDDLGRTARRSFEFEGKLSRLRAPQAGIILLAVDAFDTKAQSDTSSTLGAVHLYRLLPSGKIAGKKLFSYYGSAIGFSRSGQYLVTVDYTTGKATVGRVDASGQAIVTSYGQIFDGADLEGRIARLTPTNIAFNGMPGKEMYAFIATGSHRLQKNSAVNTRDLAMLSLSWSPMLGGTPIGWFMGHQKSVVALSVSSDDSTLVTATSDGLRVWEWDLNIGSSFLRSAIETPRVTAIAIHPDGNTLVTGARDGSIKLWAIDGKLLQLIPGENEAIKMLEFSGGGNVLVSVRGDLISIWNYGSIDR